MENQPENNIDLSYERHGKGAPLVLIHGFPLDLSIWDNVVPLLENDFDLIVPDLRGFGESSTVDAPYTMLDFAHDIAGLLDHLGVEKAAFAGHSMGGYVALAFAKEYPGRVSGLALVSSQAAADAPERKAGRYKTARDVAEKGVDVVANAMTPKLSANEKVQEFTNLLMKAQSREGVVGALKAMAEREDSTSVLSQFTFPVVLIHGDADALIPMDRAREIKSILPAAQWIRLKKAGHMPMLEFPEKTAEALKLLK
ncbi:MAG: alpha/beta fold hydrolase [Chloroflexi bacterium]|nr:alpha/beta fold hydrolase [Chloroflexota bacterium]